MLLAWCAHRAPLADGNGTGFAGQAFLLGLPFGSIEEFGRLVTARRMFVPLEERLDDDESAAAWTSGSLSDGHGHLLLGVVTSHNTRRLPALAISSVFVRSTKSEYVAAVDAACAPGGWQRRITDAPVPDTGREGSGGAGREHSNTTDAGRRCSTVTDWAVTSAARDDGRAGHYARTGSSDVRSDEPEVCFSEAE